MLNIYYIYSSKFVGIIHVIASCFVVSPADVGVIIIVIKEVF